MDTLAREVFCQTTLTIKGADAASGAAAGGDPSSEESSEERSEERSEDRSSRGAGGAEAVVASDGTGGGGIVRIHSIFETADDLVSDWECGAETRLLLCGRGLREPCLVFGLCGWLQTGVSGSPGESIDPSVLL